MLGNSGVAVLILGIAVLIASLKFLVDLLKVLMTGRAEAALHRTLFRQLPLLPPRVWRLPSWSRAAPSPLH